MILIGVPGSGKSTFARQFLKSNPGYVKLSRDEFRHMLADKWYPGEEIEDLVSANIDAATFAALRHGYNVLLDNTHCNLKTLKETITKFGKDARIVLKVIGAELSIKEIKAQNLQRDKVVPEDVIDKMYKGFKSVLTAKADLLKLITETATPKGTIVVGEQNPNLPKAIIVDIDGTVAHMGDHRGPYDWLKVDLDDPDENVLNIVRTLSLFYKVIFLSGRDGSARKKTEAWLGVYYGQEYEQLLMRPTNDFRKDNIIKKEIYHQHIKDKYYIEAVFDDRDQVVNMWREELGLKCLQVEYGNF